MQLVNRFKELADKKGCTPGQLAIAWVIAQGAIPIPGTKNPARVEENTQARNVDLSDEDLNGIRQLVEDAKPVGNR
jgi:aryl-alcohol dehydrogenase-like predicted oxidoreductase